MTIGKIIVWLIIGALSGNARGPACNLQQTGFWILGITSACSGRRRRGCSGCSASTSSSAKSKSRSRIWTDGRNTVSAVVELIGAGGPLGVWMVSTAIDEPQRFEHNGRSYWIAMRPERFYRPYSIELVKFTHERHPGTEVPSRFASRVKGRHKTKTARW